MKSMFKFGRSVALVALIGLFGVAGCASAGEELPEPQPTPTPTPTPTPDAPVTPTPDAPVPPPPDAPVIPDAGGGNGGEGDICTASSQCGASLCCFGPSLGLPEGFCVPGDEIPGLGCFPI